MEIEIWADLVCPWCFIGKRRLQNALERTGTAASATIVHRAFQLDPNASSHSEPTVDHLASKYGVSKEQARDMVSDVTDVAAAEGLHYRLDLTMTGNTRDAHRLVLWTQDTQPESAQPLMEALYSAYSSTAAASSRSMISPASRQRSALTPSRPAPCSKAATISIASPKTKRSRATSVPVEFRSSSSIAHAVYPVRNHSNCSRRYSLRNEEEELDRVGQRRDAPH